MAFIPTIGQMKMVLKFEQVAKSSDQTGGQNEQYDEWFTTRGFIQEKSRGNDFVSGYDESILIYDVWFFWRNEIEANISKDVRIVFESRSFRISKFPKMINNQRRIYHAELTEVR